MLKIKIITGSNRPGRFNIQPAQWITQIANNLAAKSGEFEVELLDLAEINLPFLQEPESPASGKYTLPHTIAWSAKIAEADGFIFVTPEYNHSYSPILKNAIDHLFLEWNYKPVAFVSYGSLAGGSRAVEHLRGVAGELKMFDLREQIMFPNYWDNLDAEGKFQFNERHQHSAETMFEVLVHWAKVMKEGRTK